MKFAIFLIILSYLFMAIFARSHLKGSDPKRVKAARDAAAKKERENARAWAAKNNKAKKGF